MRRLCLISYGLVTRLSRVVRCCVLLTIGRWTTLIEFRSFNNEITSRDCCGFSVRRPLPTFACVGPHHTFFMVGGPL
ncbi:hypothetical protein BKA82DRAFT_4181521 [Pisolithus tinctorius]|nr:hypothetical protein BKA82DRAFT_4181521 [Pisolithus tinctorius]